MSEINFADYKNIWVFAEQRDGKLMNVALELIGEGKRLAAERGDGCKVGALLVGAKEDIEALTKECFEYGADMAYLVADPLLKHFTTDAYTKVITQAINEYKPEIILYGATHIGRDLAPRVAGRANVGLTADCTHLDISLQSYIDFNEKNTTLNTAGLANEDPQDTKLKMTRPAFGGNLMATIVSPTSRPQMATVRPGVMQKAEYKAGATGEVIEMKPDISETDIRIKILDVVKATKELVSLTDADIICSGGRGLGGPEGF